MCAWTAGHQVLVVPVVVDTSISFKGTSMNMKCDKPLTTSLTESQPLCSKLWPLWMPHYNWDLIHKQIVPAFNHHSNVHWQLAGHTPSILPSPRLQPDKLPVHDEGVDSSRRQKPTLLRHAQCSRLLSLPTLKQQKMLIKTFGSQHEQKRVCDLVRVGLKTVHWSDLELPFGTFDLWATVSPTYCLLQGFLPALCTSKSCWYE